MLIFFSLDTSLQTLNWMEMTKAEIEAHVTFRTCWRNAASRHYVEDSDWK